jgi:serine/threonine protein kinase
MRRVNGLSLDKLRKQKDILISEVKYLLVQLLDTVNYIHSLSVCHRDIKPDNIIVDEYFTLFLIDFNVAVMF